MKRIIVIATLPVMLLALERVNLVKNAGFEKNNDAWCTYTGTFMPMENDSAEANFQDSLAAFTGIFSASAYTSSPPGDTTPPGIMLDSAVIIQGFPVNKPLKDLDSLYWVMKVIPPEMGFNSESAIYISIMLNAAESDWIWGVYTYYNPTLTPGGDNTHRRVFNFELMDDTSWISISRSITEDWLNTKGLPPDMVLDSFALAGLGLFQTGWMGQKVYWDDIRLTGYADYDVGIKEILSGDSLEKDTPYKPIARIKNFGSENAPEFSVIAEIFDAETRLYYDSLPWSLTSDTEDTVAFADFNPPTTGPYTLTVRTVMSPDESDEDDEVSKLIGSESVAETPFMEGFSFEILSLKTISYSIPYSTHVNIEVRDVSGRLVTKLVDGKVQPGVHTLTWDAKDNLNRRCASGVYFVRFETDDYAAAKKMVLIK